MSSDSRLKPDDWDWVTERNKCSGVAMFETLLALARGYTKKRNEQGSTEERTKDRFELDPIRWTV